MSPKLPRICVAGDFIGGSAQGDSLGTEYNFRFYDMVTWTRGRHMVKAGIGIPHIDRRAFDDNTNALGTYTFGPTLAADGVTVLQTALQNYAANLPSGFSQNTGDVHFIYHQQEMGAFIQDQFKINDRFSITPGLRYDWQNFLATRRLGFAPRASFAWVLDDDSKTVVRGGGGIYYDRFGSGPLLDLVRYESAPRAARSSSRLILPLLPATGCVPVTNCVDYHRSSRPTWLSCARRQNPLPDPVRPLHRAAIGRKSHRHRQRLLHARHRRVPLRRHQRPHAAIRLHRPAQSGLRPGPPDAACRLL